MNLLGSSKISTDNKVTIIKDAAIKLKIKQGDMLGFYGDDKGNIVIKKVVLKPEL
jgi:bifunctional DNA-binding transcriptional regulator/antitoxin component of YhaV-PrlF toxin-antitoxin module